MQMRKEDNPCEEKKKAWKDRGMVYKTAYVAGIVTLIVFHLELFSGGYFCKLLFAKVRSLASFHCPLSLSWM